MRKINNSFFIFFILFNFYIFFRKNLIEDLDTILGEIKLVQSKNIAGWYEGKSKEEGEVIGMLEEVDLDGKKKKKVRFMMFYFK